MVLTQDQAQRDQSTLKARIEANRIENERIKEENRKAEVKYQSDLSTYNTDLAKFNKDTTEYKKALLAYETEVSNQAKAKTARDLLVANEKAKVVADQKILSDFQEANNAKTNALITKKNEAMAAVPYTYQQSYWTGSGGGFVQNDGTDVQRVRTVYYDRSQRSEMVNAVARNHNSGIEAQGRANSIAYQQKAFSINYPNSGALGGSWFRTWQNNPHDKSLSSAYAGELTRRNIQRARSNELATKSAQADAISASKLYSVDPTAYSKQITNFGGEGMREFSQKELARREAIKPQTPNAVAVIGKKPLNKSTNRSTMTGVNTNKLQLDQQKVSLQKQEARALSNFSNSYKSTTRPSSTILAGVVTQATGKPITPETMKIINSATKNRGYSLGVKDEGFKRTSLITDKFGNKYDTKKGEGDWKIASALFPNTSSNQNVPEAKFTVGEKGFNTMEAAQKFADSENLKNQFSVIPTNLSGIANQYTTTWTVDGKEFDTKPKAEKYIFDQEQKKPLTDPNFGSPLLLRGEAEQIYQFIDKKGMAAKKEAEANPDNILTQWRAGGAALTSGVGGMLVTASDAIDKHVLKKEPIQKRQLTSPVTIETKGYDRAFEGVTSTPQLLARLSPANPNGAIQRFGGGVQEQWNKQSWQTNLGQGIGIVPMVAIDVLSGVGIVKGAAKLGSKIIVKTVLKSTVKDAKATTILNAPVQVYRGETFVVGKVSQTVTQDGRVFTNVSDNPYYKQRTIPYALQKTIPTAINKGVQAIKNVNVPMPFIVKNTLKQTKGHVQYGAYLIKEKIPTIRVPQGIKDVGIKAKLGAQDLSTKGGIIKRNTQFGISRPIMLGQEVVDRGLVNLKVNKGVLFAQESILKPTRDLSYKVRLTSQDIKTRNEIVHRDIRVQFGKAKIRTAFVKQDLNIQYGLLKSDTAEKFKIIGKELDIENTSSQSLKNKSWNNINNKYEKFTIPQSLINAKDTVKFGIKTRVDDFSTQSGIVKRGITNTGNKFTIGTRMLAQDTVFKAKTSRGVLFAKESVVSMKETKSNMFKILPEEYTHQPKYIVDSKSANRLKNESKDTLPNRGGKWSNIFVKRDKSALGYSTRKTITEESKATSRQRETITSILNAEKSPSLGNPVKNFNIATVKPKQNFIGAKQPVNLPNQNIGRTPFQTPNLSSKANIPKLNQSSDLPAKSFIGGIKLKFKPNAVDVLKQSEKLKKEQRVKMGYRNEPTEKMGVIGKAKQISGQGKAKVSANEFDGIGNIKTAKINPKQGVFGKTGFGKAIMNKGMMGEVIKSTAKNKLKISPTDLSRIAKRKDTGLGILKKSGQKKRAEQKGLDNERTPSTTSGDTMSKNNQQMSPLIQVPKSKMKITPNSPKPESVSPQTPSPNNNNTTSKNSKSIVTPPIIVQRKKKKEALYSISQNSRNNYESTTEYIRVNKQNTIPKLSIVSGLVTKSRMSTGLASITSQAVRQSPRLATAQSPKLSTAQSPRLDTKQTPKLKQQQKTKQKLRNDAPTPARVKAKPMAKFKPIMPTKVQARNAYPTPKRNKRVIAGILPPIKLDAKLDSKREKQEKTHGFLGNSKTDNIEGLFRRSDIIHGDKKIRKQVKADKKIKPNKQGNSLNFSGKARPTNKRVKKTKKKKKDGLGETKSLYSKKKKSNFF